MAEKVGFIKATQEAYDNLETKIPTTFYYVNDKDLYLGDVKLSNDLCVSICPTSKIDTLFPSKETEETPNGV